MAEAQLFDQNGSRKYLNAKERAHFHKAVLALSDLGERSFALMIFHTGCRISEALALTASAVDFGEGVVVLKTLKQRKKLKFRVMLIPEELLKALRPQVGAVAPDERLWHFCRTTGWKIIKRCMADAGLEGIKATPKGLRHAYAVACVSTAIPLPMLQRWLGHANIQTTSIYLDIVGEDERKLAEKVWAASKTTKPPLKS